MTDIGQVVIAKSGHLVAYLSTEEILQSVEKTFYEDGQTRIYDFMNQSFNVELEVA